VIVLRDAFPVQCDADANVLCVRHEDGSHGGVDAVVRQHLGHYSHGAVAIPQLRRPPGIVGVDPKASVCVLHELLDCGQNIPHPCCGGHTVEKVEFHLRAEGRGESRGGKGGENRGKAEGERESREESRDEIRDESSGAGRGESRGKTSCSACVPNTYVLLNFGLVLACTVSLFPRGTNKRVWGSRTEASTHSD
jgi:hypothetical protein